MVWAWLAVVLVLGALAVLRWRVWEPRAGYDLTGVVGLEGVADETFAHQGMVVVRGELWRATARRGIVQRGDRVRVVSCQPGLLLVVEKINAE